MCCHGSGGESCLVYKRFSDFSKLREQLLQAHSAPAAWPLAIE